MKCDLFITFSTSLYVPSQLQKIQFFLNFKMKRSVLQGFFFFLHMWVTQNPLKHLNIHLYSTTIGLGKIQDLFITFAGGLIKSRWQEFYGSSIYFSTELIELDTGVFSNLHLLFMPVLDFRVSSVLKRQRMQRLVWERRQLSLGPRCAAVIPVTLGTFFEGVSVFSQGANRLRSQNLTYLLPLTFHWE